MRYACIVAALFLSVVPAAAEELVRSDLPLWSIGEERVWPESANGRDGLPAQYTIFQPGEWRLVSPDCEGSEESDACQSWLRLSIASLFHGGFVVETASSRATLGQGGNGDGGIALIAELPMHRPGAKLYAVQIGFKGGSTYWLLSAADTIPVKKLSRLDAKCSDAPTGAYWREAKVRGYYLTGYCAVRDKAALRRMAEAALRRPPLSTWEFVPSETEGR